MDAATAGAAVGAGEGDGLEVELELEELELPPTPWNWTVPSPPAGCVHTIAQPKSAHVPPVTGGNQQSRTTHR